MVKKSYIIEYIPNDFIEAFNPEVTVSLSLIQLVSIVFVLVNNMFSEDIIGALALVLFPITIFLLLIIIMFLISRYKLIFNYKEMKFIKRTLFNKKIYNLNELKIETKYIKCVADDKNILKVFISFEDKIICKIDAASFEQATGFKVDSILD